jgi:dephospho-CoA kinase
MPCALRIGLTGGIGTGKSEASRRFAALGVPVIDTDLIARELVSAGQPALAEITARFGDNLLDQHGELDRAKLSDIVFSDTAQRKELENILHPRIRARAIALMQHTDAAYCIVVIPLLVERAQDYPLDRVLVVDAAQELQYQRIAQRDGMSPQRIATVLAAQADRASRLAVADDVVLNDGSLAELHAKIDQLHQRYLKLTSNRRH